MIKSILSFPQNREYKTKRTKPITDSLARTTIKKRKKRLSWWNPLKSKIVNLKKTKPKNSNLISVGIRRERPQNKTNNTKKNTTPQKIDLVV